MAITNPDFIYVAKYDIYVQRSTRLFYKRCNRGRKTEITEDELVLMEKYSFNPTDYIQLRIGIDGKVCSDCVSYVFAEAFPELVGNAELHEKYPYLYTELNHKDHVHNTWESNYPERLEWLPASINRADTSMFLCYSLKSCHPRLLPLSPKVCSLHLCLPLLPCM